MPPDFHAYWIGDFAVFMGGKSKNVIFNIVYFGIKLFQRVFDGPAARNAVHAAIKIEPPKVERAWLSTEWPRAVMRDIRVQTGEKVSVHRYRRREEITPAGWMLLHQLAMAAVGKHYDPVDLLDFITRRFGLDLPDLGDDNLVCSTTVAIIWEKVCEASGLPSPWPQGWRNVTPAGLYNSPHFERLALFG